MKKKDAREFARWELETMIAKVEHLRAHYVKEGSNLDYTLGLALYHCENARRALNEKDALKQIKQRPSGDYYAPPPRKKP